MTLAPAELIAMVVRCGRDPAATRSAGARTGAVARAASRRHSRPMIRAQASRGSTEGPLPMAALGPVPERAGLGDRARGLQRRRRRVGLLPARSRPLARLPLERGRPGGHLRRPADAVLRARALERRDPILKERIFGLTGQRGQPRRGRQGVLVVPRLDADALVDALALHVPAGGVPVRAPGRREPRAAASSIPSSSCVDTGDLRRRPLLGDHRRLRQGRARRPAASGSPSRNRGPDTATLDVLPTLWFRNTWSWGLRPRPSRRSRSTAARSSPSTRSSGDAVLLGASARPGRCSARTRRTPSGSGASAAARRIPRTGSTTTSSTAPRPSTPSSVGHQGRVALPARGPGRRDRDGRAAAGRERRDRQRRRSTPSMSARAREADEFYAELTPAGASDDEALVLRQALAGMLWSKQFYHYDVAALARRRSRPARRRRSRAARPQPRLDASEQHRRDLDARQVGVPVVRGLGPGLPLRRARPRRPGVRQGAADPAAAASGTCTPTGSCPPTSGRSATSTRRCTPGRRCACTRSTAAATTSSSSASSTSCCSTSPGG